MRLVRILAASLGGAALFLFANAADAANPRIALVIGESAYGDGALPTTANDAGLVAQVLQAAGFDVVGARDLDQKGVRESLRDFLDKANQAGPDMQAFVYFSGRALQYAGDNYLAPIDARIARDSDVPLEAVKLSDFTHALASAPGLARVVVIDGARPNSYAQGGSPLAGGLALADPEPGTILAFNAAPGSVGVQDTGDYGVYAKTLAGLMRQGGVDISQVLSETRISVNQQTQGAQIPWSAGKLASPYFLFERAADAAPVKRPPRPKKPLKQLSAAEAYDVVIERDNLSGYEEFLADHPRAEEARRIRAILAARREALFWRRARDSDTPRAYWTYLRRYPHGPHAFDAGRRLDVLAARREPPPDFEVMGFADLPPPPPDEMVYADRPYYYFGGDDYGPPPPPPPRDYWVDEDDSDWRDLPPPPRPALAGVLPTLAIAIPLMIAARAYHDRPRANGVAPATALPPPQRPQAPPSLPQGVKVTAAPATAPTHAPAAAGPGQVKFAAPTTPPPLSTKGARPAATPLPTPGATPTPLATRGARPTVTPLPDATPSASPHALATPGLETKRPASIVTRPTPLPSPSPSSTHEARPQPTREPKTSDAPRAVEPQPTREPPRPRVTEAPRAVEPQPTREPPRPRVTEAPRAVEPQPTREPPRPRVTEAPRMEPPKAAPPSAEPPKAAACGHPGQPRC